MSLKVVYQDQNVNVPDGTVAVIGADTNATVRVARPGISRRHAIAKYDGNRWVVQDASSRNGTYHAGTRIQILDVTGPTRIRLGHPSEGELIELEPIAPSGNASGTKTATKPAGAAVAAATTGVAAKSDASPSTRVKSASPKASVAPATGKARPAAAVPPQSAQVRPPSTPAPAHVKLAEDPRLDDLVKALNDTVHSIKGLTWSVWAMIAVTAILALLTLFVGVVAR